LICATNENLEQAVTEGKFRQDLLYRVNTVEIRLPALRERSEDIPLLCNYYLQHFAHKYKRELSIAASDMARLSQYHWPGNVRELAHAIERAVILSEGSELDISSVISSPSAATSTNELSSSAADYDTFDLEIIEQRTVRAALKHFQGNVSHAAKALGLTRGAMYRRLEKYGL
jgi:DNA-binding NtrC family response regulator